MRKNHKKRRYLLLTTLLLCLLIGTSAAAGLNYDRTCTFYLEGTGKYAKGTGIIGAFEDGSGTPSIVRTSLKSSAPSVAALNYLRSETFRGGNREYQIGLTLKKPGTTKVTFQSGKKTCTSTVKVLSYKNPLSVVKLSGVKSGTNPNLTGLLKNKNYATVKMSSTQKKAVLTLKAVPGWTITYLSYENPKRGLSYSIAEETASDTFTLGYFPTGSNAKLRIVMRNNANFGTIDCLYTIK